MAANEDLIVMTAVEDLKEGDFVNFHGDQFADEGDFNEFEDLPAQVQHVKTFDAFFNRQVTAVEFLHDHIESVVAFPLGHLVQVITDVEKWSASK